MQARLELWASLGIYIRADTIFIVTPYQPNAMCTVDNAPLSPVDVAKIARQPDARGVIPCLFGFNIRAEHETEYDSSETEQHFQVLSVLVVRDLPNVGAVSSHTLPETSMASADFSVDSSTSSIEAFTRPTDKSVVLASPPGPTGEDDDVESYIMPAPGVVIPVTSQGDLLVPGSGITAASHLMYSIASWTALLMVIYWSAVELRVVDWPWRPRRLRNGTYWPVGWIAFQLFITIVLQPVTGQAMYLTLSQIWFAFGLLRVMMSIV